MTSPAALAQALARLRGSSRPRVLFVTHAFGGGVARHIDELAACIEGDAELLLLQPWQSSFVALKGLRGAGDVALWFRTEGEWERLVELLRALAIDRVHFHHVHGLPRAVVELPAQLSCGYDVTLHDFFPACPGYHLTDGAGRFCGAAPDCGHCLEAGAGRWGLSIGEWRSLFGPFLAGAQRVIAPSRECARRIAGFFPGLEPRVWPHAESPPRPEPSPVRVLVPGAISPAKGIDVLEACARDAAARALPIHFRVLGFLSRPLDRWPSAPLSVTGEHPEGALPALLALERGDVVFLPAQCPETFSYTLSAALASGLPVMATDLGAFPERLAGRDHARIVPWNMPAPEMNDALLALARKPAAAAVPVEGIGFAQYRQRYLEGLHSSAAASAPALPAIEPRWLECPPARPAEWTLAALFDDGVRCGRASSLELLQGMCAQADVRMAQASAWIEEARGKLAEREARVAALQAQLDEQRAAAERSGARAAAAEERLERIERSRSWRLTAPLRALRRWRGRQS